MRYTGLRNFYNIHIFGRRMMRLLRGCDRVLELGCGGSSLLVKAGITQRMNVTGVDIHRPYVEYHKTTGDYAECICADITEVDFADNEFDAVVCMDVIEHIPKQKVLESGLLDNMKRWADRVIITTPNGWVYNPRYDENDCTPHLSGWSADELRSFGYKVRGLSGWKALRTIGADLRFQCPFLFWAMISVLSGLITYHIPEQSWHLLGTYKGDYDAKEEKEAGV